MTNAILRLSFTRSIFSSRAIFNFRYRPSFVKGDFGIITKPLQKAVPRPRYQFTISSFANTHRMSSTFQTPRGFAPLDPAKSSAATTTPPPSFPPLQAVVFDVDGTLCLPQSWMFAEMRRQLGITKGTDILDHVLGLPDLVPEGGGKSEQEIGFEKIRAVEREAMGQMQPQEGLVELMDYLDGRGVRKAICTRNFDAPVEHLITNFITGHTFFPIITRDFKPPKPSPAGILHIAKELGLEGGGTGLIMVGDSLDDMAAGRKAGGLTVLLENSENKGLKTHEYTDFSVTRLSDLIQVLENGIVARQ
ncbi:hypothetical protein TWF481_005502 [Arthrobotrys musiformis]|uniref:HAD superfamily hydrolase n=1 Tax=Arthrobotrys musiformis TaxID=47236 RepID=A0AAV9WEM1_9PEZI